MLTIVYDDLDRLASTEFYGQSLVVLDDQVNEKNQQPIKELYIRGRKIGVSTIYLTQSYYQTPKIIRQQLGYIFILKVSGIRDLKVILSEYALGKTKDELEKMYQYCKKGGQVENFFMIDLVSNGNKTFRKNWIEYLH